MGRAADLQTLVNALAFKYIAEGDVTHFHIPDDPTIESERRQIFFGAAIGIPTFYILKNTSNLFLKKIVTQTNMIHHSRRFPGYLQICHVEYCRALAKILQKDAVDLIEMLNLKETMEDLQQRLENPGRYSVTGKLTREILNELNAHSPIDIMANEFNLAAERYYRDSLRKHHVAESFRILKEDFDKRCATSSCDEANDHQEAIQDILQNRNMQKFLTAVRNDVMNEVASEDDLRRLIHLMLINIDYDMRQTEMVKNIS